MKIMVDCDSAEVIECSSCGAEIAYNEPVRAFLGSKGIIEVWCSRCRMRIGRGEGASSVQPTIAKGGKSR